MITSALQSKRFSCEVCGQTIAKATTLGVELESNVIRQIALCRTCGPIDLELMQLCREITLGCSSN
jgi:transcription elongation factor Elf1